MNGLVPVSCRLPEELAIVIVLVVLFLNMKPLSRNGLAMSFSAVYPPVPTASNWRTVVGELEGMAPPQLLALSQDSATCEPTLVQVLVGVWAAAGCGRRVAAAR